MTFSDRRIWQAFVRLADTLVADFDVVDFLNTLTNYCVDLLGVDGSRILLADDHGRLNLVAASGDEARLPMLCQLKALEGPCVDAYLKQEPVRCPDLEAEDERWPIYSHEALSAGFASVHAIPMRLRKHAIGAMGIYSSEPAGIDDEAADLGQALADVATIGILHERVTGQLQQALATRVVIEQAKGVLAERLGLPTDDAFGLIRAYARSHNRLLSDTAQAIVEGDLRIAAPTRSP